MRILIAEDDKNFGRVLRGELENAGYTADLAADGVEAVLKFIDEEYHFVILDIKMPKLDGINALRIVKKIRPEVPAITYSGNAGNDDIAAAVSAGAIRCLIKPFEIKQLEKEIERHRPA